MLTHINVWNTLDEIALAKNISVSRLARESGLCATTFNKSKRCDAIGKERYPSLGTILKVLNSNDISMTEFGRICDALAAKNEQQKK